MNIIVRATAIATIRAGIPITSVKNTASGKSEISHTIQNVDYAP